LQWRRRLSAVERMWDCCWIGGPQIRSGPGEARTILLLHIISAGPSKQPLMVRTFLKVYMELGSHLVSARTNKRHHHSGESNLRAQTNCPWPQISHLSVKSHSGIAPDPSFQPRGSNTGLTKNGHVLQGTCGHPAPRRARFPPSSV
jgi:hypothetical protein